MRKRNNESSGPLSLDSLRHWVQSLFNDFRPKALISPRDMPKIAMDERFATLAPGDEASSEEKRAFQVLINDVTLIMFGIRSSKSLSKICHESFDYYKSHPSDLDVLIDIFAHGENGVIDLSRFKYFDVTKLVVDAEYRQFLDVIKESIRSDTPNLFQQYLIVFEKRPSSIHLGSYPMSFVEGDKVVWL